MEPTASSSDVPDRRARRPYAAAQAQASQAKDRYWLHLLLFALTLASTVYAGADWAGRYLYYEEFGYWAQVMDGVRYAVPLLLFLTVHEFGHYFAARYHGIATSLPYYIPFPFNGIGNFGAVIRIRQPIPSTRPLFDVGVAGPIAGFVVALGALIYAFATLPPPEYLLDQAGHEALKEYIRQNGTFPAEALTEASGEDTARIMVGNTLLYWFLSQFFAHVPPMYEMYHYPVLFAGWLGLFFTALNLLPVGQLDGGHILYALFGQKWHSRLARGFVVLLLISGGVGFIRTVTPMLQDYPTWGAPAAWLILSAILYYYLHRTFRGEAQWVAPALVGVLATVAGVLAWPALAETIGYTGWLVWTLLIVVFIQVDHPPVGYNEPLTPRRRWLGYLAIAIFILCFSIKPIYVA